MAEPGGVDLSALGSLPAWAQTFAGIGITAAIFLSVMRACGVTWSSAKLADPEKSHADEVVEKQTAKTNEILQSILDASVATRDAVRTISLGMEQSRSNSNRLITAQEAIVRMMEKQEKADELKKQADELLALLDKREREEERKNRRQAE